MVTATIWLSFAFALGLGVRLIGLPPLVGYLAAGFILSALGHESNVILKEVSHAGVLLLLFSVGLKLRLQSLIRLEVLVGSLLHMLITVGLIYLLLITVLGMETKIALMVGVILSFSSTVVAAKVLESKRELRAFHGRVAIGILIMQDLVAVAILSVGNGVAPSPWAFLLFGLLFLRPLIHKLFDVSGHGELVILFGLLIALVVGGHGFEYFGLSSELGALLLGIMLASHKRAIELSNSIWGLKEILLVGFFLQIGLMGHPSVEMINQAFFINLLVPIKALLFFFILVLLRLRSRTSFLTSLTLATYSEFGLIVASIGVNNGWLSNEWMVMLAVAVAMSFAVNAPINRYAHELYTRLEKFLCKFESTKRHPDDEPINIGNSHIMVMGMGRVGSGAYDLLARQDERIIGLDSDPIKVEQHRKEGRRVLYADAEDPGLWSNIQLGGVHTVMLAMPEISAKILATRQLRKIGFTGTITSTVVFDDEVEQLKAAGANLVYNYYDGVGTSFALNTLAHIQDYEQQ
ncbi:MAG: cation:proton antiporter [Gammaproteobacteria bacterium]|nr:cation:proton antiporter [Gammaproteobacteria bacterium]MCW9030127.1 cation:proton antiporter [Gammaproteobacteria bacterium]